MEPEVDAQDVPAFEALPEKSYKAKLVDGTVVASGDTEGIAYEGACAYYMALMILNPVRPFQIGVYNATGTLQAVIGRGT